MKLDWFEIHTILWFDIILWLDIIQKWCLSYLQNRYLPLSMPVDPQYIELNKH